MKLNITIDDKTYQVEVEAVEPEAPVPPRSLIKGSAPIRVPAAPVADPPAADSNRVDENKVCRSPVSGIVIRVAAQVGQNIQTGDVLLVLEAMKMETNITAPNSGKVAAVSVNEGDSVQSGQVLVQFE
ncbi:MAG TPA: acetyl-CoA carboxylase biotin carboxyl carrier protein subunit [Acidobacteriota bacterium]|nr:acetyl-CoA carboxylase biotin carboxyl carrier protein subunit [Acidobacteriota bacterium]